jgi:hypothetical protein
VRADPHGRLLGLLGGGHHLWCRALIDRAIGRRRRGRLPPRRWSTGRATPVPGRSASSFAGRRDSQPPGRLGAGGDERMAERVRADGLVDPGFTAEAANDPPGGVTVQPSSVSADEDRTLDPFTDSEVDGSRCARRERNGHDLAALATHGQGAMAAQRPERPGPSSMLTASRYARSVAADHRDRPSSRTRPTAESVALHEAVVVHPACRTAGLRHRERGATDSDLRVARGG